LKPDADAKLTPKEAEAAEPTPGTSGSITTVERYKSKGKAMILSPEAKLIPFRTLNKVNDEERKEIEDTAEPRKYKYIL